MNTSHRLLFFQYLLPLVYATLFYFVKVMPMDGAFSSVIFFLAGFYLGNLLLWADGNFLYPFYNELQTVPKQLITRSALFILVYIVLGIFVITSSGQFLGVGMIFGIGLTLLSELFVTQKNPELFHRQFLFQVKRQLSPLEIQRLVWSFAGVLVVLTILFFW